MAKKTPAQPAAPKTHPLDWWHKGLYPALYLLLGIVVGSFSVYFGFLRQAGDKEVERLKIEVKQHVEQEQQAKDETQWLRVEIAKYVQREQSSLAHIPHVEGQNNNVQAAVVVALWLANLTGRLDAMKKNEADKFGEQVKELWDKAVKQADEEKPIDFSDL
jgi:hypothetical protein